MDVNEIKALISPNRPGGVSALELEKASRLIDELDDLARQTVTGCVDIARRERARAEAAEAKLDATEAQVARLALENEELRSKVANLRNGLMHWKTIAETESWPYEWDVATVIKSERDAAIAEIAKLRAQLDTTAET